MRLFPSSNIAEPVWKGGGIAISPTFPLPVQCAGDADLYLNTAPVQIETPKMSFMVVADSTERQYLPQSLHPMCEFASGVEELTGADFIITVSQVPPQNDVAILTHAKTGMCVQRKTVPDFAASFQNDDNRLWLQLRRMRGVTDEPWLLLEGDLKGTREDRAVIDGRETELNYYAVVGAISSFQLCGGYVAWLNRDTQIQHWIEIEHGKLSERFEGDGEWRAKRVMRPVQKELYLVPDVQRTLTTFPGIGGEKAESIYNAAIRLNAEVPDGAKEPTLMDCLLALQYSKIPGISTGIRNKVMKFVGWEDNNGEAG